MNLKKSPSHGQRRQLSVSHSILVARTPTNIQMIKMSKLPPIFELDKTLDCVRDSLIEPKAVFNTCE